MIWAKLRYLERRFWNKACDHDDIPRDSKFVVFSDSVYARANARVRSLMCRRS